MQTGIRSEGTTSKTGPIARAGAKAVMELASQGAVAIEEHSLFVPEMPTTANGSRKHRDREDKLDDRVNADRSATGDETIGDAQIFEDAASYQISDNNSSINNTWAEKQKDSRTYYLTHGIVTVKISPHWSSLGI
jgi:hypothetical protein